MGLGKLRLPLHVGLLVLLLAFMFLNLAVGAVSIPLARVAESIGELTSLPRIEWHHETTILWRLRLPRALLAAAVGASLATAGAVLQGLLRNGLADSYILGVSSGASLGAAAAMLLGLRFSFLGLGSVAPAAFLGALITLLIVITIARSVSGGTSLGLLLAGIAMSSFLSAVVSLLVYFSRERIQPLIFWLMGGFSARGWNHLFMLLPYLVLGHAIAYAYHRHLNAISLGDLTAHHLGVDVERSRLILLTASALLTASSVAVSGVIGFVGLMIPHIARMLVGHNYKRILPVNALLGAIFLLTADLLARIVVRPAELPVGIITALCGGPFFLYLLARRSREVL
jgi:iron complex transport system permease protein